MCSKRSNLIANPLANPCTSDHAYIWMFFSRSRAIFATFVLGGFIDWSEIGSGSDGDDDSLDGGSN